MKFYITFFFVAITISSIAQLKQFEIRGEAKFYQNKELMIETVLTSLNDSSYVKDINIKKQTQLPFNVVEVKEGEIEIKGEILYPVPFEVSYYDENDSSIVTSNFFFVSAGYASIHIKDLKKTLSVIDYELDEFNSEFLKLNELLQKYKLERRRIDNSEIVTERQKILNKYISSHPDSYVALWILIIDFETNGFNPLFKTNANLFSENLKKITPLSTLLTKLSKFQLLNKNDMFPYGQLEFDNEIKQIANKSKYTLIDFWATHCKPCIQEFKLLTELYLKNKETGFEIVSIAIDGKEKSNQIIKILKQYNIKWNNYNDYNGVSFNKFDGNAIPFNILIDNQSKIVKINISKEELADLLTF
ncbi:MAG: TlpA family protein disulfide reductase [Arcicella sp.]|jgi:thiol-disulfide isomerase/thioredoxin|nr:TlpA family protein disulfide reductase [Arcicella sp.]